VQGQEDKGQQTRQGTTLSNQTILSLNLNLLRSFVPRALHEGLLTQASGCAALLAHMPCRMFKGCEPRGPMTLEV